MDIKYYTIKFLTFMLVIRLLCSESYTAFAASVAGDDEVIRCKEKEREALVTFKQGLDDHFGYLSSWGGEEHNKECCNWHGIFCSARTGHVIRLDLNFEGHGGEILPALLDLRHLYHLDLSHNHFLGGKIPEFIGSLRKLKNLYLGGSNFTGDVPSQLGNLTNLRELDLSQNNLTSRDLTWLSNLSSLDVLKLSDNHFQGPVSWLSNLTSLSLLDLSGNRFVGPINWLSNLTSLSQLTLSSNSFTGSIPDLKASPSLTWIYLGDNELTGQLPTSTGQLSNLEELDVSHNSLGGTISEVHFSKLHNLLSLDLSFNSLVLNLTPDWIPPFQLDEIRLARCIMGPRFPKWLQTQTSFRYLDLSSAGITDETPNWLWKVSPQMDRLNVSYNQLSGLIPDFNVDSPLYFTEIDASSNNFSGPLPLFHPGTEVIYLSQNMFNGSIQSICRGNYDQLVILGLSNNQFSGELPNCWGNMTALFFLNLADNKFSGNLPDSLGSLRDLQTLNFRNNNLTGELPPTLKNCEKLYLIDGGGNELTGNVPTWMEMLTKVVILSLRRNNFYGSIPPGICHLAWVQVFDLSANNISGMIPRCFNNFTSLVLGDRFLPPPISIDGIKPKYANKAIVLWKRQETEYNNTLGFLKLIDLSSNKLLGNIPPEVSRLAGLASLNLSRNHLTGNINSDINQMKLLECLDLSKNKLSGEIPTGFAGLNYLSVLDLSSNNLSGKIPKSTQLQSFNASSYTGNKDLCGAPMQNCPGDYPRPSATNKRDVDDQKDETQSLFLDYFISAVLGFIVGFWVVIGSLAFKRSWRNVYFGYFAMVGDWLYVRVTICTKRLRYTMSRTT